MRKNVLVIGGAGYIGSNIVDELISRKDNVIIYDDISTGFKNACNKKAKVIKGSFTDEKKLIKVIKDNKINVIVCMAAKTKVGESVQKPLMYYQTNINGILSVLEAMKKTKCKNLVFASSAAIYGNIKGNKPLKEDLKTIPCNPYGRTKLMSEKIIKDVAEANNFTYAMFRIFNVAGAGKNNGVRAKKASWLIPCITRSFINKQKFIINGGNYKTKDGTTVRDYVHVVDVAHGFCLGVDLVSKNKSGIFNLCSNKGVSTKEAYLTAVKILKQKKNFEVKGNRSGDPGVLIGDNTKAKKILKWKPINSDIGNIIKTDYLFQKKYNL